MEALRAGMGTPPCLPMALPLEQMQAVCQGLLGAWVGVLGVLELKDVAMVPLLELVGVLLP